MPTIPRPVPRRFAQRIVLGLTLAALSFLSTTVAQGADSPSGVTHALLLNGGDKPSSNYQSHLHHLEEMVKLLKDRGVERERISIFSADGEDVAADLAVRDTLPEQFWLLDGTNLGKRLKPRTELTNTRWGGVTLYPARKAALREWFAASSERLASGDELLLFVTDHGKGNKDNPDNGTISLWKENLSVLELKGLLKLLPSGVRTVMVMSQCFSGTFANAMYDGVGASGNVCGFFSTTRDLRAYGCYPEGRDRDRMGHAFQFIDALGRQPTPAAAHREVLLTDSTPDVPLRTSDVYIEQLLEEGAAARGVKLNEFVDLLLAEAWRDRAAWEPQIRLLDRIGDAFGVFSPRSLSELDQYAKQVPKLIREMKTYAGRWKTTLVSVKEENLRSFLRDRPHWQAALGAETLKTATADRRKKLLADLLPLLEEHARNRPELWWRLEDLRDRAERAAQGRWRLDVRRAAILRLRGVLTGVAGRVLLAMGPDAIANSGAERDAVERLLSCEAIELGELPAAKLAVAAPKIEPFPPLADDIALLTEVLPSWVGVRFGPVAQSFRKSRGLTAGATQLRAVYPDSPAEEAGLQAGDIMLGPPERDFAEPGQFREWTMTSPQDTPLPLRVLRPSDSPSLDQGFDAMLILRPLPLKLPRLPGPPKVGEVVPVLPANIERVGSGSLPALTGRSHLLFFWATWCGPCKLAVPEVMAFAADRGIPVVAISDENADTVAGFLKKRTEDFFEEVAVDPLRKSFITFGVSGTPTILLMDGGRVVRHRQVGYSRREGLKVKGWSWSSDQK